MHAWRAALSGYLYKMAKAVGQLVKWSKSYIMFRVMLNSLGFGHKVAGVFIESFLSVGFRWLVYPFRLGWAATLFGQAWEGARGVRPAQCVLL